MRHFVINNLKTGDQIARLFNRYIDRLRMLDAIALPRETMRELRELKEILLTENGEDSEEIEHYFARQTHFYSLTVLGESLHNFHWSVCQVVERLETFFTKFEGNFHTYAVERRYAFFSQFGSEDADDYGPDEKILRKEDEESVRRWSLWNELSQFFHDAGEVGRRLEQIGSSSAEDFAMFTGLVERASDFSVPKILAGMGHEIATARVGEDGELQVLDLPDRIEAELNQDLRNHSLAEQFGLVWTKGQQLADFFRTMNQHDPAAYTTLLSEARQLLNR